MTLRRGFTNEVMSKNSYSIDCTKSSPFHKIKTGPTMNVTFRWRVGQVSGVYKENLEVCVTKQDRC